jgi:hypothetical protein
MQSRCVGVEIEYTVRVKCIVALPSMTYNYMAVLSCCMFTVWFNSLVPFAALLHLL